MWYDKQQNTIQSLQKKKKGNSAICNKMGKPWGHEAE